MEAGVKDVPSPNLFASPFENILSYVPKEHETSVQNAFYNVVSLVVFAVVVFGGYYVFIVLEPFLLSLFWAVFTGFVLFPYKTSLSQRMRLILMSCTDSEASTVFLGASSMWMLFDGIAEWFASNVKKNLRILSACLVTFIAFRYLSFYTMTMINAFLATMLWLWQLDVWSIFDFIKVYHILTLVVATLVAIHSLWKPENQSVLLCASAWTWTVLICYTLNSLSTPVYYAIIIVGAYVCVIGRPSAKDEVDGQKSVFRRMALKVIENLHLPPSPDPEEPEKKSDVGDGPDNDSMLLSSRTPGIQDFDATGRRPIRLIDRFQTPRKKISTNRPSSSERAKKNESSIYIRTVFGGCCLVQLWLHPWLLHLLPVVIVYLLCKRILSYIEVVRVKSEFIQTECKKWYDERRDILVPWPIQLMMSMFHTAEKRTLKTLSNYADFIVTVSLIFALIFGLLLSGIIVSFQLYAESAYIMQSSGKYFHLFLNSSVYQQINESLRRSELDDVIESGYHFGRDTLASFLTQVVGNNSDNFESAVLDLWDRLYQYWLTKDSVSVGPQVSADAIYSSLDDIVNKAINSPSNSFKLSVISQFLFENMGTMRSILEQLWELTKGNISLFINIFKEIIVVVFQSSSGFVNMIFSVIVYFTALFYLLSNSGTKYKPLELLSCYGFLVGDGFGSAMNKAVNSVFTLTIKMMSFYGLWTYLTHTLFRASIVTLPVLAASFLAAVPLAGQYLVAVPAALELWITEDRWIAALLLLACHFLPMWVVDPAIYAEVRRGIHPWITGLSIVGGIYCFGVPGSVYGPLILCAFYVVASMYSEVFPSVMTYSGEATILGSARKTQFVTPVIRRSDSLM